MDDDQPPGSCIIFMGLLILIAIVLMVSIVSCTKTAIEALDDKIGIKDDSIPEEIIEALIDKELHLKIDLTPRSPEIKDYM